MSARSVRSLLEAEGHQHQRHSPLGQKHEGDGLGGPDTGRRPGEPVDAAQFTEVEGYSWRGGTDTRPSEWSDERLSAEFAFKNGPVRGRYFKIHLTDIYFSATLFDFYEVHEPGLEAEAAALKPMEVGQPVEALPSSWSTRARPRWPSNRHR